jgi:hypothetical protein
MKCAPDSLGRGDDLWQPVGLPEGDDHGFGRYTGTSGGKLMAPPNPERQIHRACGDVRVALLGALELLSGTTVPRAGHDDVFRAFSDLGRVELQVALALHATNLLDQMVGTPAEQRRPWSYYRGRIGKKLHLGQRAPAEDCHAPCFDGLCADGSACGSTCCGSDTAAQQRDSTPRERANPHVSRVLPAVTIASQRRASSPH